MDADSVPTPSRLRPDCGFGAGAAAGSVDAARRVCGRHGSSDAALERALAREYPAATIATDSGVLAAWTNAILAHLAGRQRRLDLPLDVQATAFQWQALAAIPYGETRRYRDVAAAIGRPRAVRAVARACAANPVALAIPCHRVVAADGSAGGYRWGAARKKLLLATERRMGEPVRRVARRGGPDSSEEEKRREDGI
jgi:O-6-methylguanine DNA methyltransferase